MKVFVIIVTYNGKQWYDRCFGSLLKSEMPVQVVAVDNTPGEEDAEYIKSHYPEVHLITTNENLGFGKANNLGMRYALDNGCDYVFLLNQDTWIEKDTIANLVQVAEKHSDYGILCPLFLKPNKQEIEMMMGVNYDNRPLINDLYFGHVADVYPTNYVGACAWLLPRKTIETTGGFDPIFFHYEEDDNYLHRVMYHGLKVGICPSARIVHDHHDSPLSDHRLQVRRQQMLIAEWTNINHSFSVSAITRYYLRKWLSCIFTGKWSGAKQLCADWKHCMKMRNAIYKSRKENVQKKASWL